MLNITKQKKDSYKLSAGTFDVLSLEITAKQSTQGNIPLGIEFDNGLYSVDLVLPADADPGDLFTVIAVKSAKARTHVASFVISGDIKNSEPRMIMDNLTPSLYDAINFHAYDISAWLRLGVYSLLGLLITWSMDDVVSSNILFGILLMILSKLVYYLVIVYRSITYLEKQIVDKANGFINYYETKNNK